MDLALAEERRWADLSDEDSAGKELVGRYWGNLTHQDADPWSGAFMQWALRTALPESVPAVGSHAGLGISAIRTFAAGKYTLLRPTDTVRVGDVIIRPRAGEGPWSLDMFRAGQHFPAHSDLVIGVEGNQAIAVGGNKTGGKVTRQVYQLTPGGAVEGATALLRLADLVPDHDAPAPPPGMTKLRATPQASAIAQESAPGEVFTLPDGSVGVVGVEGRKKVAWVYGRPSA